MANIIVVQSKNDPKYFSYMYNEPGSTRTFNEYVARKCTVECINVSAIYNDAKQCPDKPVKMTNGISELVDKDLIIRDRLRKEHKKQLDALKREQRQGSRKQRVRMMMGQRTNGYSLRLNDTFESLDQWIA